MEMTLRTTVSTPSGSANLMRILFFSKNERFEIESVISVGDCNQTEILVTGSGKLIWTGQIC
jgi:hypothetical protein